MSQGLVRYNESLTAEEIGFLVKKESQQRKIYYKVFRILMIVSFTVPFVGAWYRATDGAPNAFSYPKYFVTTGILLFISTTATYVSYAYNLRLLQRDLRYRTKTIETNPISRKLFVAQNNSYHFYIDSTIRLSIEVSQRDYDSYNEGDEISIEYTSHSKEYLGYF